MDGKERYSKDRYLRGRQARSKRAGLGEEGASEDARREAGRRRPAASDSYSRDNAAARYGAMKRHASNAHPGLHEVGEAVAATGGKLAGKRKVVLVAVLALLCVLLVLAASWYLRVSANMAASEDVSGSTRAAGIGQPYYVLLLGSDSRAEKDEVARADSIILARVDEGAKQVTLVSMPRDLLVDIPGHGSGKLNSTLTYGGFSGVIDAVSEQAGVPISYYAVIYFKGFKKLVDDLGGVTVEVPKGTYYNGTWVPAGKKSRINGKQALVLARCRHGNPPDQGAYAAGDYQRTKNQRNLMKAIAKEALSKGAFEMPGVLETVSECVETNMPAYKMAFLAMAMRGMDSDKMYMAVVPSAPRMIGGVSYVVADQDAWKAMMKRVEAGEDPNG